MTTVDLHVFLIMPDVETTHGLGCGWPVVDDNGPAGVVVFGPVGGSGIGGAPRPPSASVGSITTTRSTTDNGIGFFPRLPLTLARLMAYCLLFWGISGWRGTSVMLDFWYRARGAIHIPAHVPTRDHCQMVCHRAYLVPLLVGAVCRQGFGHVDVGPGSLVQQWVVSTLSVT